MFLTSSFLALTGGPRVNEIITSGAPISLINISGNAAHQTLTGGHAFGLWIDGPCCPWRGGDGNTYAIFPHSENYRMQVGSWTNGSLWSGLTNCYNSPRLATESEYANRVWIFGTHAVGAAVYAIGHMEWYQTMESDDGHAGYNGYIASKRWVTSPIWLKSTDNGATWAIKTTGADRTVLKPEPWTVQSKDTLYGYRHPSNIVKEGGYYYCFLDFASLPGGTDLLDAGFCLVRTDDLESSTTWQFWNGSAWQDVNRNSYQGNLASQQPHMFFKNTGWDPYSTSPRTNRMAQSIRYHTKTGQWLLFGFRGDVAGFFCYTRSKTLASPQFEGNGSTIITMGSGDAGGNYTGAHYISVFDPEATDQNFTDIGDTAVCITVNNREAFMQNTLSISAS